MGDETGNEMRKVTFWFAVAAYLATGILQPTLTDLIRYHGGKGRVTSWPPTVYSQLANAAGMAFIGLLFPAMGWMGKSLGDIKKECLRMAPRMVLLIFALDLTAGVSKETGLLMVGGGIYVVIYSCTTLFAAMISVFVFKKALARHQWAGVLLLTFGLLLNGAGAAEEASLEGHAAFVAAGLCLITGGTVFHAAFWVMAEVRLLKERELPPIAVPLMMGVLQLAALGSWNIVCYLRYGVDDVLEEIEAHNSSPAEVMKWYTVLALIDGLHSAAFFVMLNRIGAVASALMKGVMMVIVFFIGAGFFCREQVTQCFTWPKFLSMVVVMAGIAVYTGVGLPSFLLAKRSGGSSKTTSSKSSNNV